MMQTMRQFQAAWELDFRAVRENFEQHSLPAAETRVGSSAEAVGLSLQYPAGQLFFRPGMARALGFVEAAHVISGLWLPETFKIAAPSLVHPYTVNQAYGLRIADQLETVMGQLVENPYTRRAVLHVGKPVDVGEREKPCLDSVQLFMRKHPRVKLLHVVAHFRSWDLTFGFLYDTMVLGAIGQVAAHLLRGSGDLCYPLVTCSAGSAHVYHRDVAKFLEVRSAEKYFEVPYIAGGGLADYQQLFAEALVLTWDAGKYWPAKDLRIWDTHIAREGEQWSEQ